MGQLRLRRAAASTCWPCPDLSALSQTFRGLFADFSRFASLCGDLRREDLLPGLLFRGPHGTDGGVGEDGSWYVRVVHLARLASEERVGKTVTFRQRDGRQRNPLRHGVSFGMPHDAPSSALFVVGFVACGRLCRMQGSTPASPVENTSFPSL